MSDVKFVFINDLHFGIQDTAREYDELNKYFLPYIEEHDLDIIFFGGDYFDHKLSLGESSSIYGLQFFNSVINIAKRKGIKIRIIEGTQSHDRFQPRILENLILKTSKEALVRTTTPNSADKLNEAIGYTEENDLDYKFIETADVEELCGMKVCYIPEEYPMNISEFYAKFREDQFDLMIMHGTWDFIGFTGDNNERNDINTAPTFIYKEWEHTLEHGVAICGHIHGRHVYKTKDGVKIIYPASFTAWSFDQISERGFLSGVFNTEKHSLKYEFVKNPESPVYAKLNVSELGLDLANTDIDVIKAKIEEQKGKVSFLDVDLNDLPADKKVVLKEYYKNDTSVKTTVENKKALFESSTNDAYKKFDYLLNDELTIEAAIQRYMKETMDKDVSIDYIKSMITEEPESKNGEDKK